MKSDSIIVCEKAIRDSDANGMPSLIALFSELTVQIAENGDAPPRDGVVPKQWTVFTRWSLEEGDIGREYVLNIQALWPDGATFVQGTSPFSPFTKPDYAVNIVRFEGAPLGK